MLRFSTWREECLPNLTWPHPFICLLNSLLSKKERSIHKRFTRRQKPTIGLYYRRKVQNRNPTYTLGLSRQKPKNPWKWLSIEEMSSIHRRGYWFDEFWKLVQKSLDIIFGLPIILPCAQKWAVWTFKKEEPELSKQYEFVRIAKFILDKEHRFVYTNCSKVLHQMTAPWGGVIYNKIAWVWEI